MKLHHVLSCLILFGVVACVDRDVERELTSQHVSGVETSPGCTNDSPEFKSYFEVATWEKANPTLFATAIEAYVKSGAKCTATATDGTCASIEPVKDEQSERISGWPVRCYYHRDCPREIDPDWGLGCLMELNKCCVSGVSGPICIGPVAH